MSLADIGAEIDSYNYAMVQSATWGHLAPEPRKKYEGTILWMCSEYDGGTRNLIRSKFSGLPDSPWIYDDMNEYIDTRRVQEGKVYLFTGTYMKFKNGGYRFSGKNRKVKIPQ